MSVTEYDNNRTGIEVAIIGMSAKFPASDDVQAFWRLLKEGGEGITHFSDYELQDAGYGQGSGEIDSELIRSLGLLNDIDLFDAGFFGYSPADAEMLDPQQRIFLESTWAALENSGYVPDKYNGRIGIYAGCGINSYILRLLQAPEFIRGAPNFQHLMANDKDHLSTRAAYKLNLTGPAVTVQTACSTSLVAVHLACRSLLGGECEIALAGAATIGLTRDSLVNYQAGNIVAKDGHCRPFDTCADGTVVSNGVGVIVLKRLEDAIADGDTIRAIISATAVNNDGHNKVGYMSPGVTGQADVIREALALSGVDPETISYVEAHGTGTQKGDPIELAALTKVYREYTRKVQYCALGSVKGNIGHPDTAAGIAGLIKTVLALENQEIPATVHYTSPNRDLDLHNSPFYVSNVSVGWERGSEPRRAAVSSFGIGGTNAHLILEEAPKQVSPNIEDTDELIILSAKNRTSLRTMGRMLAEHLAVHDNVSLRDVAYTLHNGRSDFRERKHFVGNRTTIIESLKEFSDAPTDDETVPGFENILYVPGENLDSLLSLFKIYYKAMPGYRKLADDVINVCEQETGLESVMHILQQDYGARELNAQALKQAGYIMPLSFALNYSIALLFRTLGITLHGILGANDREIVAACLSGVISFVDGIRLVSALNTTAHEADSPGESGTSELDKLIQQMSFSDPKIPYLSSLSGGWITREEAVDPVYWQNLVKRISYDNTENVPYILRDNCTLITVEREPSVLREVILSESSAVNERLLCLSGGRSHEDVCYSFLDLVGRLWSAGIPIDGEVLYGGQQCKRVVLPTYAFSRESYWKEPGALTESSDAGAAPDSRHVGVKYYRPAWKQLPPAPVAGLGEGPLSAQAWLVFSGESDPVAEKLIRELTEQGVNVINVNHGESYLKISQQQYLLNKESKHEYAYLCDAIDFHEGSATQLVFADSFFFAPDAADPDGVSDWFYVPLFMAQALGDAVIEAGRLATGTLPEITMTVLSRNMYSLDGEEPIYAEKAVTKALGGVIAQEYPHIQHRIIDLSEKEYTDFAVGNKWRILFGELYSRAAAPVVLLRGRKRWIEFYDALQADRGAKPVLREEGVYLITGGLGGIGLEIAEHLAKSVAAKLVLVSRSPFPERSQWSDWLGDRGSQDSVGLKIRRLQNIIELGGEVYVISADVGNTSQMQKVKRQVEEKYGAVNGIIHAAGNAPQRILQRMTMQSAWSIMQAKVSGVNVLKETFLQQSLDFFVLFSSLRSLVAAPGGGDYAAANAYLDAFSHSEWQKGNETPVISINWAGWAGTGMTLEAEEKFGKIEDEGGDMLTVQQGLDAFCNSLAMDSPQIVVSHSDVNLLIDRMAKEESPSILEPRLAGSLKGKTAVACPEKDDASAALPRNSEEAIMVSLWEEHLGVSSIGIRDDFLELGGDSVSSIQISARANQMGVKVDPFDLLEHLTIEALFDSLKEKGDVKTAAEKMDAVEQVPLTPIQQWFFDQEGVRNFSYYNQAFLLCSTEALDEFHLETALVALRNHHDALRSRFVKGEDGWEQYHDQESGSPILTVYDLSMHGSDQRFTDIERLCNGEQGGLSLAEGNIIKAALFRSGSGEPDRLLVCIHHLAVDAISWNILMQDLQTAYRQLMQREDITLPAKTTSYGYWAERLQEYGRSEQAHLSRDYWERQLRWKSETLPRDYVDGENTVASIATVRGEIDLNNIVTHGKLPAASLTHFLTATGYAIAYWMENVPLVIDLEGHGREPLFAEVDLSRTVGWFTTLFPFCLEVKTNDREEIAVDKVRQALESLPNNGLDFGVQACSKEGELLAGRNSEIMVLYLGRSARSGPGEGMFSMASESPGATQEPGELRPHVVEVIGRVVDKRLLVDVAYSCNIHRQKTLERFVDRFTDAYIKVLETI